MYDGRGTGKQEMGRRRKGGREGQVDEVTDALDIVLKGGKPHVEIDSPPFDTRKHNSDKPNHETYQYGSRG